MTPVSSSDGENWAPATPIGWQGTIDFEVHGTGPYEWYAYDEDVLVGKGEAETRVDLENALRRAKEELS